MKRQVKNARVNTETDLKIGLDIITILRGQVWGLSYTTSDPNHKILNCEKDWIERTFKD